jgi:ubiquitin C-terminal hydrolase
MVEAPRNLIVHLKRFKAKGKKMVRDDTEVIIERELDLAPFGGGPAKYELCAVVNHNGELGFGHYTAYGKRRGSWWYFNDTHVVARDPPTGGCQEAYLLYYTRAEPGHEEEAAADEDVE